MKRIHYYTVTKFSKIFFSVLLSVVLLTIIIDFVELTRRLSEKSANLLQIIELTFLKQPLLILDVMPFVILLTAILFLVKLSDNSEITIFKSSGVSLKTIFKGPLVVVLLLSFIEIFLFNNFATFAERTYKQNISNILSPNRISESNMEDVTQELWFKQNQQDVPYIFKSQKILFKQESLELYDITLIFLENIHDQNVLYAQKAEIKAGKLDLYNISQVGKHNEKVELVEFMTFPTSVTKEFIKNKLRKNASDLGVVSIWDVLSSIKLLKEMGFSINKQVALLNCYIIKPVFYVYLFLLASIFCIYPPRHQKKVIYIISSVLIGFTSYFLLNIGYTLAAAAKLSIIFGIWLPNILLLLLALYFLIKKEQGYL